MNTFKPILYLYLAIIALVLLRISPFWPVSDGSTVVRLLNYNFWIVFPMLGTYAIALTIKFIMGVRKEDTEVAIFFKKYSLDVPGLSDEQIGSKIKSISIDRNCPERDRHIACQLIKLYDKLNQP